MVSIPRLMAVQALLQWVYYRRLAGPGSWCSTKSLPFPSVEFNCWWCLEGMEAQLVTEKMFSWLLVSGGSPLPPLSRWKYVYPPCSRGSRMSFENAAQWEPGTILINRLRSVIVQRSLCLHENDENLNMALGGIGAWWLVCAEHSIRIYWDATLEKQCWRHLLLAFGMISDNSHWNLQQGNIVEPFCIGILFPDM